MKRNISYALRFNYMPEGGFALLDVLIAALIVTIVGIAVALAFSNVSRSMVFSRMRTVANNLAQEKVEAVKSISYGDIKVTSAGDLSSYGYDNTNEDYVPETVTAAGVQYKRYTTLWLASEQLVGGKTVISTMTPSSFDCGVKKIKVEVKWVSNNRQQSLVLYNLITDPEKETKNGVVYGFVTSTDTTLPLADVEVAVVQNMAWSTITSATGYYIIETTMPATVQVTAFTDDYFSATSNNITIPARCDLQLSKIPVGIIDGYVVKNDHLIISLVVATTIYNQYRYSSDVDEEYVQLYNPTTWQWEISNDWPYNHDYVKFYYVNSSNQISQFPSMTYRTDSLPSYAYYLIGNQSHLYLNQTRVDPDAYYDGNVMTSSAAAGVAICNRYNVWLDSVSWGRVSGEGTVPPSKAVETKGFTVSGKSPIAPGYMLYRIGLGSTGTFTVRGGGANDSNDNSSDFCYEAIGKTCGPPYSSSLSSPPASGTPACGAFVSSDGCPYNDITDTCTVKSDHGAYYCIKVTSGSCNIHISLGNCYADINNISIRDGEHKTLSTVCLNSSCSGSSSSSSSGTISGVVMNGVNNKVLPGILVSVGAYSTITNDKGKYVLLVDTGPYMVIANPNNNSSSWTSDAESITVPSKTVVTVPNLLVYPATTISGLTRNDVSAPLPYVMITASVTSVGDLRTVTSGPDGTYKIVGIRTGSCSVYPIIGDADTYTSDKTYPVTLAQGVENSGNNFTIYSGRGKIRGTARYNNGSITTGALIIATTGPVPADPPPSINSAFIASPIAYYGTVSIADGSYELVVKKGYSYNIRVWYARLLNNNTITTISKTAVSGQVNDATSPVTVNLTLP